MLTIEPHAVSALARALRQRCLQIFCRVWSANIRSLCASVGTLQMNPLVDAGRLGEYLDILKRSVGRLSEHGHAD
jgi:hypothetical protein